MSDFDENILFPLKKNPLVKSTFLLFLLKKKTTNPQHSFSSEFGFTLAVTVPHDFPLQVMSTAFKNITISTEVQLRTVLHSLHQNITT